MNKTILVTNDDGVRSEGIHALAAALRRLGDVIIVAPHGEASAIGHALTLRRPLRMEQVNDGVYEVDGTPTDCVNICLPPRVFLNVNVPEGRPKGLRVTVQAKRNHVTVVAEREDPRHRPYYWIEEGENDWEAHGQSAQQAG